MDDFYIPKTIWKQVLNHVDAFMPEEACGLLAGKGNLVSHYFPVENILHSPTRYRMEPQQQLSAFQQIEALGLDLLAIYHSHPVGPANPSPTDVSEAYYPEVVYIIITKTPDGDTARAFHIRNRQANEISLKFTE